MELNGQVALVTGGARRLGRAFVLALADAGCDLCVHYAHSSDAAEQVVQQVRQRGVQCVAVQADFLEPTAAATTLIEESAAQLGPPSILVNSAAIFETGTLATTDEDSWDRHFNINLKAPLFLCRQFARQHPDGQRGQIINIADWRATRPGVGHLAYTLTKSGIVTLTQILAQELAPGIAVNAIAPGAILPAPGVSAERFASLAAQIPLQRTGSPQDLVAALLFLLRSDFITGEVIHVAGGEQL